MWGFGGGVVVDASIRRLPELLDWIQDQSIALMSVSSRSCCHAADTQAWLVSCMRRTSGPTGAADDLAVCENLLSAPALRAPRQQPSQDLPPQTPVSPPPGGWGGGGGG